MVQPGAAVSLAGTPRRYVSRGGDKLEAALGAFEVNVEGRRALDAGASTGGFTDCLLQCGVGHVVAVDVGYGQLAWRLRNDPSVTVIERTNIRIVESEDLGGPFDLIVADLSFISIRTVAAKLASFGAKGADWVLLVKPQFEVGRTSVGRGGIVRDPELHASAMVDVAGALTEAGISVGAAVASPLTGAKGNREFFVHGRRDAPQMNEADLRSTVLP